MNVIEKENIVILMTLLQQFIIVMIYNNDFPFSFFQNGRSSSESSDDTDRWQPVFVAVTDRELR